MQTATQTETSPTAILHRLKSELEAMMQKDREMRGVFDDVVKFKARLLVENARQHSALKDQAKRLNIKVGNLPDAMGAGLALLYDRALENLWLRQDRDLTRAFSPRSLRLAGAVLGDNFGHLVKYTEMAMARAEVDQDFADRLRLRAGELNYLALDNPQGPCEYCVLTVEDKDTGEILDARCGTKDECDILLTLAWIFIIFVIIYAIGDLFDWW